MFDLFNLKNYVNNNSDKLVLIFYYIALVEGIRDGKFPEDPDDKVKCYPKCVATVTKIVKKNYSSYNLEKKKKFL